jgi:hypothetical protein
MNQASKYTFVRNKKKADDRKMMPQADFYQPNIQDIDTNVVSIDFKSLRQAEENLEMGDPNHCQNCKACLSSLSQVFSKDAYRVKYHAEVFTDEEEKDNVQKADNGKKIELSKVPENSKVWVCEFCTTHNVMQIEHEEIPSKEDVVYMLQSVS